MWVGKITNELEEVLGVARGSIRGSVDGGGSVKHHCLPLPPYVGGGGGGVDRSTRTM